MPDDNRLDGIANKLDSGDADDSEGSRNSHESDEVEEAQASEKSDDAPFAFEDTDKKSVYGLPETIDDFETTLKRVELTLLDEHGVKDVSGRELQNAALQALVGEQQLIAEEVLNGRDE